MTPHRVFQDLQKRQNRYIRLVTCHKWQLQSRITAVSKSSVLNYFILELFACLFLHNPFFTHLWHFLPGMFYLWSQMVTMLKKHHSPHLTASCLFPAKPLTLIDSVKLTIEKRKQQKCKWVNCTPQVSVSIISPCTAAQRSHCDGCGHSCYFLQSWNGCALWACHWASGLGSFQSPRPKSSQE